MKSRKFQIDKIRPSIGLLVANCERSNINGGVDEGGAPRQLPHEHGWVMDVSVKRKMRNIIMWNFSAWQEIVQLLELDPEQFQIMIDPKLTLNTIKEDIKKEQFIRRYWDARIFGNTFIEEGLGKDHVRGGPFDIQSGISVAPVEIITASCTRMAGVQEGKDCGMAPDRVKIVPHAVYIIPFYIAPDLAVRTGCSPQDIEVALRLLPHIYSSQPSTARPSITLLKAHFIEFNTQFGAGVVDIFDSLKPVKKENPETPSQLLSEYIIPSLDNDIIKKYDKHIFRKTELIEEFVGW